MYADGDCPFHRRCNAAGRKISAILKKRRLNDIAWHIRERVRCIAGRPYRSRVRMCERGCRKWSVCSVVSMVNARRCRENLIGMEWLARVRTMLTMAALAGFVVQHCLCTIANHYKRESILEKINEEISDDKSSHHVRTFAAATATAVEVVHRFCSDSGGYVDFLVCSRDSPRPPTFPYFPLTYLLTYGTALQHCNKQLQLTP